MRISAVESIKKSLREHAQAAASPERFFKTQPGQYAAHDKFLGVAVPHLRRIAKQHPQLSQEDLSCLLQSSFNEERLLALLLLVQLFKKADEYGKKELYNFYMSNLRYVNNWNLVDSSAHLILGAYVQDKDRSILITLARSANLWERRIAIIATWVFIRSGDTQDTYRLATLLLYDTHDLMHKAVGWMLREAGKKDLSSLLVFLDQHAAHMPRTMLRYALEKLSAVERKKYLDMV